MADVDIDVTQVSGIYGVRPNETLGDAIRNTMTDIGSFTVEDEALAADLQASLGDVSGQLAKLDPNDREHAQDSAYFTKPIEATDIGETGAYSTDSGDVSQVVPLDRMTTATWPVGTPAHSWQAVAASVSTGMEGMLYAADTIGRTLVQLLTDPNLLADVIAEFNERSGANDYESPMPDDADSYNLLGIDRPTFNPDIGGNINTVGGD
ncbi:zinc-binding metallopeptidase family protein [Halalkalicoccus subterraneus]|uniref:hypothetical protein n=1 Tax=Halalkalicoccus subterraneus TaxID=2675002 RepID=UPI000EFBE39A|nr:hypothetical protein [Halalkalicoccus subterraneus]